MICIIECWDSSSDCQCPVCKKSFSERPELRVNTIMSELAEIKKSAQETFSSPSKKPRLSVLCEICSEEKHEAQKSCLTCEASFCQTYLEPHERISYFKRRHKLIDPVENLKDYICQKHVKPLEMFCRDDQKCVCKLCTLDGHKNHNTVPIEEESEEKKTECKTEQAKAEQMVQDKRKKIEEIKIEVEDKKRHAEQEKGSIERNQDVMLKILEENQRAVERQDEEFIEGLEQEITELKRRNTELEQISNTEDHLHLLQKYSSMCTPPPTKNCPDGKIKPHLDVETPRRARAQFQGCVDEGMKKIVSMELKRIRQYAVDVILDPKTAHPKLILSDDGKQVTYGDTEQELPDNPERFDTCVCVLGKDGFSSGRFYYEVEVTGKTEWDLGVTRESSDRKIEIIASPEEGYWSVYLRNKNRYEALESPFVPLYLKHAPQKVGVFVDHEKGLVSFYDVENESHIYSFTGQTFTEKLYPYFSPCPADEDENSAPLIICPVSQVQS